MAGVWGGKRSRVKTAMSMGCQWNASGMPVGCQWDANGMPMGCQWEGFWFKCKVFFAEICVRSHLAIPAVFFKYPLFFYYSFSFYFFFYLPSFSPQESSSPSTLLLLHIYVCCQIHPSAHISSLFLQTFPFGLPFPEPPLRPLALTKQPDYFPNCLLYGLLPYSRPHIFFIFRFSRLCLILPFILYCI